MQEQALCKADDAKYVHVLTLQLQQLSGLGAARPAPAAAAAAAAALGQARTPAAAAPAAPQPDQGAFKKNPLRKRERQEHKVRGVDSDPVK